MTDQIAALTPDRLSPGHRARAGIDMDETEDGPAGKFWTGDDGPSFGDFLDMINPLQHIPVISAIYRAISGDEIGDGPRTVGSVIYGGPVGMLLSGMTALFEEASGDTVLNTVARLFDGGDGDGDAANAAENPDGAGTAQQQAAATPATEETPPAAPAAPTAVLAATQTAAATGTVPFASPLAAAAAARPARLHGMNQIPYNPAAALGAVQAAPMGLPVSQPAAAPTGAPPQTVPAGATAAPLAAATPDIRFPAQRVALTFDSNTQPHVFPAHPGRAAARSGLDGPVQHQRVNPAVAQAEQTQMDRLISRWAQQQAAIQKARATETAAGSALSPAAALDNPRNPAAADPAANGLRDAVSGAVTGSRAYPAAIVPAATVAAGMAGAESQPTGHPMLPPQNANPGWYAEAMSSALSKYQSAQGLPAAGAAAPRP